MLPFHDIYPAEAVLEDRCDLESANFLTLKKPLHFYLGPAGNTPQGTLTIDYGKIIKITQVHIQNSHNLQHGDSSTKDFKVEMSKYFINWITVIQDELKNTLYAENCGSEEIETFQVFGGIGGMFRYLKITAVTMQSGSNQAGFNLVDITYE